MSSFSSVSGIESTENVPAEETFMCLLKFASVKRIKDFVIKNPSMNLHYPTSDLKTPLTAAIDRADTQIVSFLLEKCPSDLDNVTTQPCGRTVLMYASFTRRTPEILQCLLKKGADVQKRDMRGWTCLHYAIVGERLKNLTFLLDYGISVDQRDLEDRTPLMISAYLSNLEILSTLLNYGAEVDARDKEGFTALQLAILWRKRDAAIALIEKGCDVSVVTPLTGVSIEELCTTSMPNILRCIELRKRKFRYSRSHCMSLENEG